MPESPNRVAIDRVEWSSVLPVLRLVSAFRHALQPGKLVVALVAVLLIHASGLLLDLILADGDTEIYGTIIAMQGRAFDSLMDAALSLELGIGLGSAGVVGALRQMFVAIPHWAFNEYPWFTVLFGIDTLVVLGLSSGVICRMAATQVCRDETTSLIQAARFVAARWAWYLLTPLMPALLILVLGAVLIVVGLVVFNIAFVEMVGALGYGLLLLIGFVIALVSVLLVFALFLMAPSLSVEGSDGFDAIARAFNYVMFRPWQFAGYLVGAVVYAAVVYVLVAALAGLTAEATHGFVEAGSIAGDADVSRFERIVYGRPGESDISTPFSTWVVHRWLNLLAALVIAVMFSVVCCLQTQVYVLMRRAGDGTPLDDCAEGEDPDPWSTPADVAEPEATPAATEQPADASAPSEPGPKADDPPAEA